VIIVKKNNAHLWMGFVKILKFKRRDIVSRASMTGDPISRVKCVVDSCEYWGNGDMCKASAIEIQPPEAADSQETDCATFSPK